MDELQNMKNIHYKKMKKMSILFLIAHSIILVSMFIVFLSDGYDNIFLAILIFVINIGTAFSAYNDYKKAKEKEQELIIEILEN